MDKKERKMAKKLRKAVKRSGNAEKEFNRVKARREEERHKAKKIASEYLAGERSWVERVGDSGGQYFVTASLTVDERLKQETVGLISPQELRRKRERLEEEERTGEVERACQEEDSLQREQRKRQEAQTKRRQKEMAKLSFGLDDDEDNNEDAITNTLQA